MGFSRREYWSGLPRPPPGDLSDPGIGPTSPALQVGSLPTEPSGKTVCHSAAIKGGGKQVVWRALHT